MPLLDDRYQEKSKFSGGFYLLDNRAMKIFGLGIIKNAQNSENVKGGHSCVDPEIGGKVILNWFLNQT